MLFVSYASQDRALIEHLLATLRRNRQQVWWDDELGGGEAWWQAILEQIRRCEVFIVAVSNNSLASKPCQAELQYAESLRRPILPVQISPIDSVRVTPLAARQILDFRDPSKQNSIRLLTSVQRRQAQVPTLPWPLPPEPQVPFAYLMRLAAVLTRPALSRHQQAELMIELKDRLEDDRHDPTAFRDLTQLLRLLRDRADVTWRIRTEIDATLASIESPTLGATPTVPFTGPQSTVTGPFTGPQSTVTGPFSGPQPTVTSAPTIPQPAMPSAFSGPQPLLPPPAAPDRVAKPRRIRRRWIIVGALGVAVSIAAGIGLKVALPHANSDRLSGMLVSASDVNTIMGADDMQEVESGKEATKESSWVSVTPPICMAALYPGMDSAYQGTGMEGLSWKVMQKKGGHNQAGENNNRFVDQDIAAFTPNSDQASTFVTRAADQWKHCAGQSATASYRTSNHKLYRWEIGAVAGDSTKTLMRYTAVGGTSYACQRALSATSIYVIDVKACGPNVTDEASRIVDKIAAGVADLGVTK